MNLELRQMKHTQAHEGSFEWVELPIKLFSSRTSSLIELRSALKIQFFLLWQIRKSFIDFDMMNLHVFLFSPNAWIYVLLVGTMSPTLPLPLCIPRNGNTLTLPKLSLKDRQLPAQRWSVRVVPTLWGEFFEAASLV